MNKENKYMLEDLMDISSPSPEDPAGFLEDLLKTPQDRGSKESLAWILLSKRLAESKNVR